MVLYRGQLATDPVGLSWSWRSMVALGFARAHYGRFDQPGEDAVILRAIVPASHIICAPSLDKRVLDTDLKPGKIKKLMAF